MEEFKRLLARVAAGERLDVESARTAFDAMMAFLDAEGIDLHRIVHGEQRFAYVRPLAVGDELSATLTVTGLRQIGGADIIATTSELADATGAVVCTGKATLVHSSGAETAQ